jgi:hypothetical protein
MREIQRLRELDDDPEIDLGWLVRIVAKKERHMEPDEDRPGLVSWEHPAASHETATLVMPRTGTYRRRVLDHITSSGEYGATDVEIQMALGISGDTERPRRVELCDLDLIVDSGRARVVRGRKHTVWVRVPLDGR